MSNATAAPRKHLTKSWTTNDTNLKMQKRKSYHGFNYYCLSWGQQMKKSVNCLWYNKHLISVSILSPTRWRYLHIDRCVSPIIWAWPIVCWTLANILGTIYIVNQVLWPTTRPKTLLDRNACTWSYLGFNFPVSSTIGTPTLISVSNGAFSTCAQIARVNWRKWSRTSTTAMLRSCCKKKRHNCIKCVTAI